MDTGEGIFKLVEKIEELEKIKEQFPKRGGVFKIGEVINIKGSRFKIQHITQSVMKLRLLPKE